MKNTIDVIMQDFAKSRWILPWLYPLSVITSNYRFILQQ